MGTHGVWKGSARLPNNPLPPQSPNNTRVSVVALLYWFLFISVELVTWWLFPLCGHALIVLYGCFSYLCSHVGFALGFANLTLGHDHVPPILFEDLAVCFNPWFLIYDLFIKKMCNLHINLFGSSWFSFDPPWPFFCC